WKAAEFADRVIATRYKDRGALYLAGHIANDRMILAQQEYRYADALAHAHESAGRLDTFLRLGDAQEAERAEAASQYGNIAIAHIRMHLYEEAIPYARREEEITATIPSARVPINVGLISEAIALSRGDLEGGWRLFRKNARPWKQGSFPLMQCVVTNCTAP